jgi:hypothetical protein
MISLVNCTGIKALDAIFPGFTHTYIQNCTHGNILHVYTTLTHVFYKRTRNVFVHAGELVGVEAHLVVVILLSRVAPV